MPDDITSQILETLLAMPKEKRADAFKKIKESGVQLGSPEDMQRLNKMFGGGDMYLPPLPGGPQMRPNTFETTYGPTGPTQVRKLAPERAATQANVTAIAANKKGSLNPLDWIMPGGKSPIPAAVEGGANFLAGMTDAAIQTPGDWRTKLMSGVGRGAANVLAGEAMNAATGREPEAGSAHNITSLIPSLPKRAGGVIGTNALSTGLGEAVDADSRKALIEKMLNDPNTLRDKKLTETLQAELSGISPVGAGLAGAGMAGGMSGVLQGAQAAMRMGMLSPAARQDLAKELHKRRSAPPSAIGSEQVVSQNAQDLANLAPSVLREIKQYAPNSPIRPSARNAAFDTLIDRTGFDIKAMSKEDWAAVKQIAKESPDQIYGKVIEPIFDAANYSDLAAAAKKFNQNVTNVATLAGKDRAAVLKGVRNAFVQKLFEDNDVRNTGQIVNPDSLRYRAEAIGPDMFNQIFSDSPNPKNQASGAYDAFKTILDLAEQGSRTNKYHDLKVFITKKGPALLRIPLVGSMLETPLDQDAMFKGKNKSSTAAAAAALGFTSPGTAAAVGALEVAEFSWDKFFDTFAKKNSRTLPILKAVASGDTNYSQTSIERAIQTMFDLADRREKRKLTGETWDDGAESLK